MHTNTRQSITDSRKFAASPEKVYDAWIDPQIAKQWLFVAGTEHLVRADVDARVGGKFCFTDRRDGVDVDHVGEYFVLNRPHKLGFTFTVPMFSKEFSRVTIDIAPVENGCELTMHHEDILPEWAERSKEGWAMLLDALEKKVL